MPGFQDEDILLCSDFHPLNRVGEVQKKISSEGKNMQKLLRTPGNEAEWHQLTSHLLKAHMTILGMRYSDLVDALARIGVTEDEVNLRNRIPRGRFSATLLLQCLRAMGVEQLMLPVGEAKPTAATKRDHRGK